jgi:hypothetical protein
MVNCFPGASAISCGFYRLHSQSDEFQEDGQHVVVVVDGPFRYQSMPGGHTLTLSTVFGRSSLSLVPPVKNNMTKIIVTVGWEESTQCKLGALE